MYSSKDVKWARPFCQSVLYVYTSWHCSALSTWPWTLELELNWSCPVVTVFVLLSVLAYLYLMGLMVMVMTMMMAVSCFEYMALDAGARLCQTDAATKNINLVKNTANDISLKFLKRVWGILKRMFEEDFSFECGGNWFYSVSWTD